MHTKKLKTHIQRFIYIDKLKNDFYDYTNEIRPYNSIYSNKFYYTFNSAISKLFDNLYISIYWVWLNNYKLIPTSERCLKKLLSFKYTYIQYKIYSSRI
jgi:hypothetical protein